MISPDRFQRAVELFERAAGLGPGEREAFLVRSCGDDAELRREVESLLEHDAEAVDEGGPIDAGKGAELLAGELFGGQPNGASHEGHPIPQQVGKYRVLRLIGHGGMGAVYEAEQENPKRRVALKMVRPGMGGPQLMKRLQREAHVLGLLQHPGIGQVYEAGFAVVGGVQQPYFAMEFIHGLPLDAYADRRGLCDRARLELIARTCDAVHYAHERGIIHRDLKPGNICVVSEGDGGPGAGDERFECGVSAPCVDKLRCAGQPKVLDFGVARLTDADRHLVTLQTEVGQLVGTLSYMSPEQIGGRSTDVDRRSDIYALGVILHELLSGDLPHDIRAHTIPEAARIIRDEEPSRLGSINAHLRGDIETIVAKAIEKDPQRRYQTAAEMAADIRRYLHDEPIRARPASGLYQFRKFARRHKGLVTGAVVAVAALVVGLAATSWLAIRESSARRIADRSAYRTSLAAAMASLRELDIATAGRHLENAPVGQRDWLWRHLAGRLDGSLSEIILTEDAGAVVERAESELWFWDSDRRLSYLQGNAPGRVWTFDTQTWERVGDWQRESLLLNPLGSGDSLLLVGKVGEASIVDTLTGETRTSSDFRWPLQGLSLLGALPASFLEHPMSSRFAEQDVTTSRGRVLVSPSGRWRLDSVGREVRVQAFHGAAPSITLAEHPEGMSRAVFSPDERFVYTSGYNRDLACFDLENNGRLVWRREDAHSDAILALALHPDGSLLASGGEDRVLRVWDAATGTALQEHLGHKENILSAQFSESGNLLASASSLRLMTWPALVPEGVRHVSTQGGFVESVSFDPATGILLTATREEISLWDGLSGAFIARVSMPDQIGEAALCGRVLLCRSRAGLTARDLYTMETQWQRDVAGVAASGGRLVVQPPDGNSLLLDPTTGEPPGPRASCSLMTAGSSRSPMVDAISRSLISHLLA